MAEDIKSALHDATPSWNGFNYQGKVGLYVCLTLILEKLNNHGFNSQGFTDFLENHSIEYEWIEDFSIKKNEQYLSLHQVKHKAGTGFSDHISAIVTILNRKLGRLSETDFVKYIDLDIDYTGCTTQEEKNVNKLAEINSKFGLLIQANYIDDENKLKENWEEVEQAIAGVDRACLLKLLKEFESFSERTFENSKVYFHTAESVSKPIKDINEYSGIPDYHQGATNGLQTLAGSNIYLGFDNPADYQLVLSDDDLTAKIHELIKQIIPLSLVGEHFSDEEISLYQAALYKVIDKHIAFRHSNIRLSNNVGDGFEEQRNSLTFSDLFSPLKSLVQQHGDEYWEWFCTMCFEEAYQYEVTRLENHIHNSRNVAQNQKRKVNLEKYRKAIINKYKYTEILSLLNPQLIKSPPLIKYFSDIAAKDKLVRVFLSFVRELESGADDLIIKNKDSLAFHPSAISIEADEDEDRQYELHQTKHQIQSNNQLTSLAKATHLVVKASPGHDLSNERVQLLSLAESIEAELTNNIENSTSDVMALKFESLEVAVGKIN